MSLISRVGERFSSFLPQPLTHLSPVMKRTALVATLALAAGVGLYLVWPRGKTVSKPHKPLEPEASTPAKQPAVPVPPPQSAPSAPSTPPPSPTPAEAKTPVRKDWSNAQHTAQVKELIAKIRSTLTEERGLYIQTVNMTRALPILVREAIEGMEGIWLGDRSLYQKASYQYEIDLKRAVVSVYDTLCTPLKNANYIAILLNSQFFQAIDNFVKFQAPAATPLPEQYARFFRSANEDIGACLFKIYQKTDSQSVFVAKRFILLRAAELEDYKGDKVFAKDAITLEFASRVDALNFMRFAKSNELQ